MLDTVPEDTLPGFTPRLLTQSDIANFDQAWDAALRIDFDCCKPRSNTAGWTSMGKWRNLQNIFRGPSPCASVFPAILMGLLS